MVVWLSETETGPDEEGLRMDDESPEVVSPEAVLIYSICSPPILLQSSSQDYQAISEIQISGFLVSSFTANSINLTSQLFHLCIKRRHGVAARNRDAGS